MGGIALDYLKFILYMIAFLGTGLLGSGFVRAALAKGVQVKVWNRTKEKADALTVHGAVVCETAAEAVENVGRVHLVLKDDVSVDEVLQAAAGKLAPGTVIVDHTTTSVEGARRRTEEWSKCGITYQHAPVFMGPANSLAGTGYMLVSGNQGVIAILLPELEKMTGKVLNYGDDPGKAAGMKLAGNLLLIALTAGLSDVLALTKSLGIPATDVADLFNEWNPGAVLPGRLKKITDANFDQPTWELAMARKDAGLMINEARENGAPLVVIPAVAAEMDRWINKGCAKDDWTVIAKDNI